MIERVTAQFRQSRHQSGFAANNALMQIVGAGVGLFARCTAESINDDGLIATQDFSLPPTSSLEAKRSSRDRKSVV